MKDGVLQHRRRVPHGGKTQHVHEVPDLERCALLRKHTESLALTLKKESVALLLVADDAAHAHPVPRSLGRRKPEQLRKWNFRRRGLHLDEAQARNVEQDARELSVGVVKTAAYTFNQDFAVHP